MLTHDDFLAWSPDGKLLAVTAGGGRETWSHKRIAVVELASGQLTSLTDDKTAAFSPIWSPDGQHIAYVAAPDIGFVGGGEEAKAGAAQRRIWVMKKDGSDQRQLTHDAAYRDERSLWLADGRHLLFARLDQSERASLWLVRSDGSQWQQVVDELSPGPGWFGNYGHIQWSDSFAWWPGVSAYSGPK
jgi:Tol biopolymer transport system component